MPAIGLADWPANGRALCTAANTQLSVESVTDGAGGAIIVWQDERVGGVIYDVYAQHLLATGSVDPGWPADGHEVCTVTRDQWRVQLVTDGIGVDG